MTEILYRNRRAFRAENENIRVTVTAEGGHIAEIFHKSAGMNPLWTPPWPSIEPSLYDAAAHPEYGTSNEASILGGLMGHNICLDTYGPPSPEEFAAGIPVHGEGPVVPYRATVNTDSISLRATLPLAQLRFERRIHLSANGRVVNFHESLENLSGLDRPVLWTQHVTMGPPFLEHGRTEFRAPATRSKVYEVDFGGAQKPGAEFEWPNCPLRDGGSADLRVYPNEAVSAGFTTHLLDTSREHGYFAAWSPDSKLAFGYAWKRHDFPWLCRWEENRSRTEPPWNGKTVTCAIEFGVSPMVGSRRSMVQLGSLFGVPAYRWLPARARIDVEYCAFLDRADAIPESIVWDGKEQIDFA
jgi:hypothetical protein